MTPAAEHAATAQGYNGFEGGGDSALNGLGDDPTPIPFEEQEWNIVPFTDPRSGETYNIVDGRVIVALTNPPQLPVMPFDYFDVELPPNDPYYIALQQSFQTGTGSSSPAVAAFIVAENLEVYSEWEAVGSIAVLLPQGETVLDAVTRWPQQYPLVVTSADPDSIVDLTDGEKPNDALFLQYQWPQDDLLSTYNINWLPAWRAGYYGNSNIVIAVLDTGVEYHLTDLRANSTPTGCNVYDKWKSTCFFPRTQEGGGEPDSLSKSRAPMLCGHGTSVASIVSAIANNGPGINIGTDIAGIAPGARYYPIGMKTDSDGGFSVSVKLNAINAVGVTKGIFKSGNLFSGVGPTYYNIKVANCSWGAKYDTTVHRLIKTMSPYILFVCAAGNDGNLVENKYPAALTRFSDLAVMSVAAYNKLGNRSIWSPMESSSCAPDTSIAAPGSEIPALDLLGSYSQSIFYGWVPDPQTAVTGFYGTSAAAPFVCGAAALVISRYPSLTPMQVKARLIAHELPLNDQLFTSRSIDRLNVFGSL